MTEQERNILNEANIDVEDAMGRFLDNEELYIKFLNKFTEDENFSKMREFLINNNVEDAFGCAHTVKGVAANLSVNGLYQAMIPFVEYLRDGNLTEAKNLFPEVEEAYQCAVHAIIMRHNYEQ